MDNDSGGDGTDAD